MSYSSLSVGQMRDMEGEMGQLMMIEPIAKNYVQDGRCR